MWADSVIVDVAPLQTRRSVIHQATQVEDGNISSLKFVETSTTFNVCRPICTITTTTVDSDRITLYHFQEHHESDGRFSLYACI